MCGIFGYFLFNKNAYQPDILSAMESKIRYRGPDGYGFFEDVNEGIGFGNRRLAIVDIAHGGQPFFSKDRSIAIVQNGEIFNYKELMHELKAEGVLFDSHSDTEVILRLYEKYGINFLDRLNGMFAIAIYDQRKKNLYLARDRAGVKPLYYYQDESKLFFGSEIKSIIAAGIEPKIDQQSLALFMTYNYVPSPHTIFQSIVHVKPGHYLEIDADGIKDTTWWQLNNTSHESYSESQFIEEFNAILSDAVRLRMQCDVPYGAFLSGGLDSSSVLGMMKRHSQDPIKTFSIGFHDKRFDESIYAFEASQRFGSDHVLKKVDKEIISLWPDVIYHCDQPHGDTSFIPTLIVSKLASEKVKVVLTGDGGDELFGGYEKYVAFLNQQQKPLTPENYLEFISLHTRNDWKSLFTNKMRNDLQDYNPYSEYANEINQYDNFDVINQMLLADFKMLLPGNNLVKPDRMGMAASIEARNPFLDYRMIEFAFRVPGNLKINNQETRYAYKKAVKNLIGENLTYRKKQMFTVPFGEWIRSSLKDYGQNMVNKSKLGEYLDLDFMTSIMTKHLSGEDYTRQIRQYLALEYWYERFCE